MYPYTLSFSLRYNSTSSLVVSVHVWVHVSAPWANRRRPRVWGRVQAGGIREIGSEVLTLSVAVWEWRPGPLGRHGIGPFPVWQEVCIPGGWTGVTVPSIRMIKNTICIFSAQCPLFKRLIGTISEDKTNGSTLQYAYIYIYINMFFFYYISMYI